MHCVTLWDSEAGVPMRYTGLSRQQALVLINVVTCDATWNWLIAYASSEVADLIPNQRRTSWFMTEED